MLTISYNSVAVAFSHYSYTLDQSINLFVHQLRGHRGTRSKQDVQGLRALIATVVIKHYRLRVSETQSVRKYRWLRIIY